MASGETGGERRAEILDVAAELFSRRGYDGASMRDIAEGVGILPGSLYHHFASKEALFAAVHQRAVDGFVVAARAALAADRSADGDGSVSSAEPPSWRRLRALCRAHLAQLLTPGARVGVLSPSAAGADAALAAELKAHRDVYERLVQETIDALEPPPRTDPKMFRLLLLGAMNWTPVWYRPDGAPPEAIADTLVDALLTNASGPDGDHAG